MRAGNKKTSKNWKKQTAGYPFQDTAVRKADARYWKNCSTIRTVNFTHRARRGGVTMPDTNMERARHDPPVLVDTEGLTREEWLGWRRHGIGGSDLAAIIGISPFRTARDIYYDKLGIAAVEEDESNWVALEMGHLLEDLVAKIFERKTGLKIYQIKKMFRHPLYPFMLADVDYFITMPDGTKAILEIKTTNKMQRIYGGRTAGRLCRPIMRHRAGTTWP